MSPTMSSNGTHKDTEAGLPYDSPSTTPHAHKPAPVFHARTELTAFIGEFIGTFMFLALAFCGTQIALNGMSLQSLSADDEPSRPDVNKLLYIAFAFGVSLAINVAIFADVSGAKFNPAVTLALYLTRKIHWPRLLLTITSQIIAGMAAAGFVAALLPGPLTISTTLHPSISVVRGLFLEAFVTSMLILMILMLEGGTGKPMYVGLTLFIAELCSVFYTGGSLNPARSFGPSVVVGFERYHWIYWIGPCLGAAVASGAFWLINWVRHEKVESVERDD